MTPKTAPFSLMSLGRCRYSKIVANATAYCDQVFIDLAVSEKRFEWFCVVCFVLCIARQLSPKPSLPLLLSTRFLDKTDDEIQICLLSAN
jgi:hypothetical protein